MMSIKNKVLGFGALAAVCLVPCMSYAHTTNVCWRAETDGSVTFYAATYHGGTSIHGGMIIDGQTYNFTGNQASLPADITGCQPSTCSSSSFVRYQSVNVDGLGPGEHSFTTTTTTFVEYPWPGCYPQEADFGNCEDDDADGVCGDDDNCPGTANADQADADGDGAGDACDSCPNDAEDDADGDGVCGDVDVCGDSVLPEDHVPTVSLGEWRFADVDGDGVFDTADPAAVPHGFDLNDTAGCTCEQIIEQMGLDGGHKKHGCAFWAMEDWVETVSSASLHQASQSLGLAASVPVAENDQDVGEQDVAMGCTAGGSSPLFGWSMLGLFAAVGVARRRRV